MSFGGGGGGNDDAFWAMKKEIDDQKMAVDAQNAALALTANQKRLALYSGGGLSALATAGYAGYAPTKQLGTTAPLGTT